MNMFWNDLLPLQSSNPKIHNNLLSMADLYSFQMFSYSWSHLPCPPIRILHTYRSGAIISILYKRETKDVPALVLIRCYDSCHVFILFRHNGKLKYTCCFQQGGAFLQNVQSLYLQPAFLPLCRNQAVGLLVFTFLFQEVVPLATLLTWGLEPTPSLWFSPLSHPEFKFSNQHLESH